MFSISLSCIFLQCVKMWIYNLNLDLKLQSSSSCKIYFHFCVFSPVFKNSGSTIWTSISNRNPSQVVKHIFLFTVMVSLECVKMWIYHLDLSLKLQSSSSCNKIYLLVFVAWNACYMRNNRSGWTFIMKKPLKLEQTFQLG